MPSIFLTTLLSVAFILTLATLFGRAWGPMFPYRFRGLARFYLAPVLGLATLAIIASLAGWFLPLGNSVVVPVLIVGLLLWALSRELRVATALSHCAVVTAFGLACGASVLGPLFAFGAFNAHNDAFTYLVHSNWLQEHAFGENIAPDRVTASNGQVASYQRQAFRMGGSFLVALAQAVLNLRWSYEVYPAVVISAVAACCLAIGFSLARSLHSVPRRTRLIMLALPAFTLGGLVFGANLGFLPQTVGLALGAGLLFTLGPQLQWLSAERPSNKAIAKAAVPSAVLFAGTAFAYHELVPFILAAALGSGLLFAIRFRTWRRMVLFGGTLIGLSASVLNTELVRAYAGLRKQVGVVVGSPVDWSFLGFVAHAFGIHGGAWDGFQWTAAQSSGAAIFAFGMALTGIFAAILLLGRQAIWRATLSGALLPSALMLVALLAALLYFRYIVPSPFPAGTGQSWSQFKLSDWAHPFAAAFVLVAATSLRRWFAKGFNEAVTAVFLAGLIGATLIGVARVKPLIQYYRGTHDLSRFYQEFRQTVLANCPHSAPVYLDLNGHHHKFRQMAAYYLPDRELTSDWMDDGYIFKHLPVENRTQTLRLGDCVVTPIGPEGLLNEGASIGPFRIGVFRGPGRVRIVSAAGAYDREEDRENWWHWVPRTVTLRLQSQAVAEQVARTRLRFSYATRGDQSLTVRLRTGDGATRQYVVYGKDGVPATFDKLIDLPPTKLTELTIESDGKASRLGEHDDRLAAWIVRNVAVSPAAP